MIKIQEAVVVEGKYDKIKLSNIIDAFIIETNGFGIYKDKRRLDFIRALAEERGVIILTDSDHSGFQIRNFIASGIPKERLNHIYIPDLFGKEKRKDTPSAEGKLGVEGMPDDVLIKLFEKAGVSCKKAEQTERITKCDMYLAGLSGTPDASVKRKKLLKALELPEFLSANSLLSYLNFNMSKADFLNYIKTI